MTPYLWVPTLWFLLIFSRPFALWFGSGGATIEEGSADDRIALLAFFVIALTALIRRRFDWSAALRAQIWVALLLGFMLVSTVWSEAPFISFRRWFTAVIAVTMVLSVQSEPLPRLAIESLLRRVVYICVPFSYLLIHYFPQYGKIYVHTQGVEMWTGVTIHKNSLAQLCLVAFLLLAWRIVTSGDPSRPCERFKVGLYGDIAVLVMTVLVFMGPDRSITYSATTTGATMGGLCCLGFLLWLKRRGAVPAAGLLVGVSTLLIVYGTITPFLGRLSLIDVSSALGRNSTLTGRTEVWAALRPAVMQSPLLGYGYGGFWTTQARELYDISGTHNGYLGVILEIGFLGWVIFACLLVSFARAAQAMLSGDFNWGALCVMVLASSLVHNIAEESLKEFSGRLMAVVLLLSTPCRDIGDSMRAVPIDHPEASS